MQQSSRTQLRSVNNLWDRNAKIDYKFATLEPKHYAAVCGLFDINDPKLLMGEFEPDYRTAISYSAFDWADIIHAENGLVVDLRKAVPMAAKAANCELTEADLASLRSLKNPFYPRRARLFRPGCAGSWRRWKAR